MLLAEFLRAQAAWRLARSAADPVATARCAAALLDAAAFAAALTANDRDLTALAEGGCFHEEAFDPGPQGVSITRWWQYRDAPQVGPRDLIRALGAVKGVVAPS
jgi:hypothetical protein